MRTDLHIHTTASDGCWTPERLIQGICEHSIELFAVADHDTVENVIKTENLSIKIKAKFIRAVEINSTFCGKNIHILGYGIDPDSHSLGYVLAENRKQLELTNIMEIKKAITLGYAFTLDEYFEYTYDKQRGGWKSLNFLIDHHICQDIAEYNALLRSQISHHTPEFVTLNTVLDAIRDANGIPILAHPGASFSSDTMLHHLDLLSEIGIAGVECFAQYHDEMTTKQCVSWCQTNNMIITGGSDYHGGFVNRKLGIPILDHANDLNLGSIFHFAV